MLRLHFVAAGFNPHCCAYCFVQTRSPGKEYAMPLLRRSFLELAGAAAVTLARPGFATAQSYPARPVRLVVGFPAGGPNDILARLVGQWLSDRLGQPFIVENMPGASGNIATEAVVRAPTDGYTLLLVGPANAISASLYPSLNFDFLRDIAPIAGVTREPLVMVVHPSVPAKTTSDLIAYAKANPGKIRMASTGNGSSPHVSGELFKMMTGLELAIVHYAGGGPALKAMIEGQAEVMFEPMSAAIEPIRTGKLRALAVTTATRSDALPEIPVLADVVAGYEASAATGIGAPRNTPPDVIGRLNREINAAFADPGMKARLVGTGGTLLAGTPEEFGRLLAEETEKWAKVIKRSGAKSN
jgi:tripartite-type tricarboxylate transporter receptor subunit TctC